MTIDISPCVRLNKAEFVGSDSDNRTMFLMLLVYPGHVLTGIAFVEGED